MRHPAVAAVLALMLVTPSPLPAAQEASAEGQRAGAAELLRDARRAVGAVVRVARGEAGLEPETADAKPFWEALKQLNEALDRAETGLTLQDETFFTSLAAASAAVRQAEIALSMTKSGAVREPFSTLARLVRALDESYGKEAARLRQGGELTAAERRQLEQLKAKQDELQKQLDVVKKKAGANDERIREGARKIEENSRKIRNAPPTVGGFVGALVASRIASEMLWGWHWWWGPWGWWCPGFIDINIIIWDDWIVDYPYDWALAEVAIDVTDFELDSLPLEEVELMEAEAWLEAGDFDLDPGDMEALTRDLDAGWDEVDTEIGAAVMEELESSFEGVPFEEDFELHTFDDFGFEDFGADFDIGDFDF